MADTLAVKLTKAQDRECDVEVVAFRHRRPLPGFSSGGVWSFLTADDAARVGITPEMEPLYLSAAHEATLAWARDEQAKRHYAEEGRTEARSELELARQEIERFRSERNYVVGCNDGYAAAQEQYAELKRAAQGVIDWCDLALKLPEEFDSHGVRNLDGPAFDDLRALLDALKEEGEAA